jgi:hypothetical protein
VAESDPVAHHMRLRLRQGWWGVIFKTTTTSTYSQLTVWHVWLRGALETRAILVEPRISGPRRGAVTVSQILSITKPSTASVDSRRFPLGRGPPMRAQCQTGWDALANRFK